MRRPQLDMSGKAHKPVEPSEFSSLYPTVWEFLTAEKYDGEVKPRLTSTVLFFLDNGTLKACFNDRDNARSFFMAETTWESLLEAIECALRDDTADWKMKSQRQGGPDKIPW